ncbi:MAG: YraN family protein [Pseudomonadota bacterium]
MVNRTGSRWRRYVPAVGTWFDGDSREGGPERHPERSRRKRAERAGRLAETLAVIVLVLKGYRILGRRFRCMAGEIDVVAVRGRRLAFVEVKRRSRRDGADMIVTSRQAGRIAAAARYWVQRHPRYRSHAMGLDRCDVTRNWCIHHQPDALQPLA